MNIERRENPLSEKKLSETWKKISGSLTDLREIQNTLDPYVPEIPVKVDPETETPIKVVHAGDTHFPHEDADPEALNKAIKETGEDGILITMANIIDGVSNKFISTNTTRVHFILNKQIMIVKALLRKLDKQKRVVPIAGNTCHEGWAVKQAAFDPTPFLVSEETPVLYSGGQVIFEAEGKKLGVEELYHNPGRGRTDLSPEAALRARSREIPVDNPDRPDALIGAHSHMLTACQDVMHNPIERKDVTTSFGVVGSAKGTKENPDRFLIGLGVAPRNQPADAGQGLVTIWRKGEDEKLKCYPVAGYDRAQTLFQAEQLWEDAQRTGNYKELKEIIRTDQKTKQPKPKFIKEESLTRRRDEAAHVEGKAPLYKTLAYNIDTDLPLKIQFIGNLRVGSSSLEREKVKTILEEINNDPWSYYFATRRLINSGVSRSPNREKMLANMANLLSTAKSSLLGIMLTDELRSKAWVKPIKERGEDGKLKVVSDSLFSGDWLHNSSAIKNTPLMMPETVVKMKLNSTPYTLYIRDQLSHFTSLINPEHGLTRIQQMWGIDADALIGGHMEVVGWRTWMRPWGQLEVIVPGGFNEYIEKGIGNRVDYPTGGQGLIMFPDKKLLYSFATPQDGKDMHEALWMYSGLKQMDKLNEIGPKLRKQAKSRKTAEGSDSPQAA